MWQPRGNPKSKTVEGDLPHIGGKDAGKDGGDRVSALRGDRRLDQNEKNGIKYKERNAGGDNGNRTDQKAVTPHHAVECKARGKEEKQGTAANDRAHTKSALRGNGAKGEFKPGNIPAFQSDEKALRKHPQQAEASRAGNHLPSRAGAPEYLDEWNKQAKANRQKLPPAMQQGLQK